MRSHDSAEGRAGLTANGPPLERGVDSERVEATEMRRGTVSVCVFCGTREKEGYISTEDGAALCDACAHYIAACVYAVEKRSNGTANRTRLWNQWLLTVFPAGIALVGASLTPAAVLAPWGPLLRGLGSVAIVVILFLDLWPVLARRSWRPGLFAPVAWALCGAYLGHDFGLTGALVGTTTGLVVFAAISWIGAAQLWRP